MKKAISLFLILIGFLPFFSPVVYSQEPDYIAPEVTRQAVVHTNTGIYYTASAWCEYIDTTISDIQVPDRINPLCTVEGIEPNVSERWIYSFNYGLNGGLSGSRSAVAYFEDVKVCEDPDYQIPVDSDGIDGIDQCHRSSCPDLGVVVSSQIGIPTSTGNICLQGINGGSDCQYQAIENDDGSRSDYTFTPSGQGCACSDSELIPCIPLEDVEISNTPEADGCVMLGESVFCEANVDEKCPNGICEAGCGYVQDRFMCVEATDPNAGEACKANDTRPECQGIPEGECPAGQLNCITDDPPPNDGACTENDPRQSCQGVEAGGDPNSSLNGATSEDIAGLGAKIDQTNKNLKDIKEDTKKIADELTKEHDAPEIDPDDNSDWSNTKTQLDSIFSDVATDAQTNFESTYASEDTYLSGVFSSVLPTAGTCSNLSFNFPHASGTIDACNYLINVKIVLEWILILAFIVYLKSVVTRIKPN